MFIDHAFLTILRAVRSDISPATHMALLPERKATSTVRPINILLHRSKAGITDYSCMASNVRQKSGCGRHGSLAAPLFVTYAK